MLLPNCHVVVTAGVYIVAVSGLWAYHRVRRGATALIIVPWPQHGRHVRLPLAFRAIYLLPSAG